MTTTLIIMRSSIVHGEIAVNYLVQFLLALILTVSNVVGPSASWTILPFKCNIPALQL
jgi:hypothetical protein